MSAVEGSITSKQSALPRAVVIAFILAALFFVVASYDRDLPVAHLDEGYLFSQTIRDRGVSDFATPLIEGYPPVVMYLYTGVQEITETLRQESVLNHGGLVLHIMRASAAAANAITVLALMRMGYMLGYPLVGLVAGLVWSILPLINHLVASALTEPYQVMFITLAAWAMLKTLQTPKRIWALLSTLFGVFAVFSKYSAFPALGFGVGASLFLLLADKRRSTWSRTLVVQILMIAAAALWLMYGYGVGDLLASGHQESTQFVSGGLGKMFDLALVYNVFSVVAPLMELPHLIVLVAILVPGLGPMWRKSDRDTRVTLAYWLIFVISFIWIIPLYLAFDNLKERYVSPVSSLLALLIVLALWHLLTWLAGRLNRPRAVPAMLLLVCLIWMAPSILNRLEEVRDQSFADTGQAFVQWAARSLEPDAPLAMIGIEGNTMRWRYFSSVWGDYHGPNHPLVDILFYLNEPKSAWIDAGIRYVHLTGNYPGDEPALPFERDTMLLLKTFPNDADSANWRGDPWYIYRLQPYQTASDARFANTITLRGYDLPAQTVSPGDTLTIRPYWQASQPPTGDYNVFMHLSSLDGHDVLAQSDGPPSFPARMTSSWTDPTETLVGSKFDLVIPPDLPAGTYRILLGLYDLQSGQRLNAEDGQDFVELAAVTVEG